MFVSLERLLAQKGEHKRNEESLLGVEIKVSPHSQLRTPGISRCISVIPGDNFPGAVEAVKRAVELITQRQQSAATCKVVNRAASQMHLC